jgi:hypothetical protein
VPQRKKIAQLQPNARVALKADRISLSLQFKATQYTRQPDSSVTVMEKGREARGHPEAPAQSLLPFSTPIKSDVACHRFEYPYSHDAAIRSHMTAYRTHPHTKTFDFRSAPWLLLFRGHAVSPHNCYRLAARH